MLLFHCVFARLVEIVPLHILIVSSSIYVFDFVIRLLLGPDPLTFLVKTPAIHLVNSIFDNYLRYSH